VERVSLGGEPLHFRGLSGGLLQSSKKGRLEAALDGLLTFHRQGDQSQSGLQLSSSPGRRAQLRAWPQLKSLFSRAVDLSAPHTPPVPEIGT
jgi:hypothetical protein